MWEFAQRWLGLHHASTYMIFVALVMASLTAHPTTIAYLSIIGVLGPFLFITREVARMEGHSGVKAKPYALGIAGAGLMLAFLLMLKINWVAI